MRVNLLRLLAGVTGLLILSGAAAGALYVHEHNLQDQAFESIRESASEESIRTTFGQPDQIQRCGEALWWGRDDTYRGKNDGRCINWMIYWHFLGGYGVGFDAQDRVVSKYQYISP